MEDSITGQQKIISAAFKSKAIQNCGNYAIVTKVAVDIDAAVVEAKVEATVC